jgi:hypothetical protein
VKSAVQNLVQLLAPSEADRAESRALSDYLNSSRAAAVAQEMMALTATLSALPPDNPLGIRIKARLEVLGGQI